MKIKYLFTIYFTVLFLAAQANSIQFISIGVDGLTCSMCTRSVEMSIRKLDFVDNVIMDLENTEGKVYLKHGASADLRKIAKAVTNAGFSVRFLRIHVEFEALPQGGCFSIGPDSFQFIESSNKPTSSQADLVLIGDEFMSRKELLAYKKQMLEICPSKNGYYVSSL